MVTVSVVDTSVLAPTLQAAEGGSVAPWWIWLILISVLLLLLLIGLVFQSKPGEPIPRPEERTVAPAGAAETAVGEEAHKPQAEPDETSGEE
ncbi:MAG TPA: hypothetical protein VLE70_15890 [Anaerolineae bacterium]|jgi:hypothetical protein|nr:hypothetical protein [Anaerolineae bacterium]